MGKVSRVAGCAAAIAAVLWAKPARADVEWWNWFEYRLPVTSPGGSIPRTDVRLFTDVRLNLRSGGLDLSFFRAGPLVFATPWLFVALHGTVISDRMPNGRYEQETRIELEPNLFGRLGNFTFNDRNRLEHRWRVSDGRFRYRNQMRVNYAPPGARWIPFFWDEVLVDLAGEGFNQNRATGGLAYMLQPNIRLEVAYMIRSRAEPGGWEHDRIALLSLFIDAPESSVGKPCR